MGWARLDDGWHDHRKTVDAGLEAAGLWAMCLTWAHKERRTKPDAGGVVPDSIITRFAGSPSKARKLTARLREVGYLDEHTPSGWPIHDFDQYLPKGHDSDRAKEYGAKGGRPKKPKQVSDENLDRFRNETSEGYEQEPDDTSERNLASRGSASARRNPEPVPLPEEPTTTAPGAAIVLIRDDVERVCVYLADWIERNGSKRPTISRSWRDQARLLIDLDGRSVEQVITAIDWCQRDTFWRANVLSMPGLREKYDQLRLQAQRDQAKANGANSTGAVMWNQAIERHVTDIPREAYQ